MATKKFGPRNKEERKQRSKKAKPREGAGNVDSNVEVINPEAAGAKAARRQQLQNELRSEQGQMSSKKKKRLDKYIENKLRKEETLDLIKRLALHKADVSGLQSSRTFAGGRKPSKARRPELNEAVSESSDDETVSVETAPPKTTQITPALSLGAGLKRPLERDASGAPIIRKRQRVAFPSRFTQQKDTSEQQHHNSHGSQSGENEDGVASESSWSGISDNDTSSEAKSTNTGNLGLARLDPAKVHPEKLALIRQLLEDDSASDDEGISDSDEEDGSNDEDDDSDDDSDGNQSDDEEDGEAQNLLSSIFQAVDQARRSKQGVGGEETKRDVSGFKEWANQQMNEARDFAPSRALEDTAMMAANSEHGKAIEFTPRPAEQDELPPEMQVPARSSDRKAHAVLVERTTEIQAVRSKLPVVAEEQKIMEAIHNNPVTIVCGATGSGKTTQVPQFLFEAGFGDARGPTPGMIAVTQPRRVAAVTMAQRVAKEMGSSGNQVAYQIRYGSTVTNDTAIKFMTDGILIREIASDFKLTKYSAIVIDEAHERGVNTDILIGMLSRIVDLRADEHREDAKRNKPLKLIVMSATLMADAFLDNARLFRRGAPPLVQSEGKQYPVVQHFARRTRREYVDEAFNKITRGHKKLPPGAMLVFMTGESEILTLNKRLREAFGLSNKAASSRVQISASEAPLETEDFEAIYKRDDFEEDEESDYGSEDEEDEFDVERTDEDIQETTGALVLPLYSKLPTKDQLKVFEPPPKGIRLIILATNVAETSITIPGVRYVFDCGRAKEKVYNQETGVQSFEIGWISKASATQRAGRAGRTGPGHCYRLYSSAVYERDFKEHTEPEILRMPIEGVVLQLKSMDLQHVVNFPFPTPPDRQQIVQAEKLLSYLGAIDAGGKVTSIGRDLSIFPISPRYAKMLAIGHQQDCMLLTVAMVAALATPELFIPESQVGSLEQSEQESSYGNPAKTGENEQDQQKKAYRKAQNLFCALDKFSDAIKLLAAFGAYASAPQSGGDGDGDAFCKRMFMRPKAAREALQLFRQLVRIVADNRPGLIDGSTTRVPPPRGNQVAALKKIAAVGFIDQVAVRADLLPVPPSDLPKAKRAADVAYVTLFPSHDFDSSTTPGQRCVYVHASSVLAQRTPAEMPMYVVYSALQKGALPASKVRMHPITNVSDVDLAALAKGTPLLEYGKPVGKVEPVPGEPNKRVCWVVPSLVGRRGTVGWPLREQKVLQRKIKGVWEVEKVVGR